MSETRRPPVRLTEISSRAWEHPADRGALVALRRLRGFDTIVKKVAAIWQERAVRMTYLGSSVRVNERQFPRIYRAYVEAGVALDVPELPELFVRNHPVPNAMCIGMDKPIIVIHSALLEQLGEAEIRFVLGHELGHAQSGHAVYRSLLMYLMGLGSLIASIPLGALGLRVIIAGLMEWQRKSELSADRAGLLACQDLPAAMRNHMLMASGGHLEELDTTEFLAQAAEYRNSEHLADSLTKLFLVESASHPEWVVRAAELRRWVDSGAYATILGGDYPRRSGDAEAKISDEAKAAAESYAKDFEESEDALAKLLKDLGSGAKDAAAWLGRQFRG